jgi:hypothetical protein
MLALIAPEEREAHHWAIGATIRDAPSDVVEAW